MKPNIIEMYDKHMEDYKDMHDRYEIHEEIMHQNKMQRFREEEYLEYHKGFIDALKWVTKQYFPYRTGYWRGTLSFMYGGK